MATYLQKATLATDADFLKRVSHAVAKFARDILNESETTPNHTTRFRWAVSAVLNPSGVAASIAPAVTLDSEVEQSLAAVTDSDLQAAVEVTCAPLLLS